MIAIAVPMKNSKVCNHYMIARWRVTGDELRKEFKDGLIIGRECDRELRHKMFREKRTTT